MLSSTDDDTETVREELMRLAQASILRETFVQPNRDQLDALMVQAIAEMPTQQTLKERGAALLEILIASDRAGLRRNQQRSREQLVLQLTQLVDVEAARKFVRHETTFDDKLPSKAAAGMAARAINITGRVLDGIQQELPLTKPAARWMIRCGPVMQGLLAVSTPGSLLQLIWRHTIALLFLGESILLLIALALGPANLVSTAVAALAATVALYLLSLLVGDYLRQRSVWARGLIAVAALVFLGLAVTGALAWTRWGMGARCGPLMDGVGLWPWAACLCRLWPR